MVRAQLDKNERQVSAMFDEVAEGYDRTRAAIWLGRTGAWGRAAARVAGVRAGHRVLDVAAGTGSSTIAVHRPGVRVVGCDFSLGMLRIGRRRVGMARFVAGDALRLPFADASFDVVTMSFGLRNTADVGRVLAEMRRVCRPGGRLVVCDFSHPPNPVAHRLWLGYLRRVVPLIARLVSTNPQAYVYLWESINAWHRQPELAGLLRAAGWAEVGWTNLTGGAVALHYGVRP
ncbi:ubiquinone/menaquinone biosynthesis methyltransferase [Micromonospora sp. KC213]|uniref:ubiquinone/menaquinone biosynthesis methyltransferase n=1 Tax=Micromonospora sp. KC213 TaxID=2530378 RepID=UPI001049DD9E|nr:ubiquinone/menaquinone biosynthesis methyltransferase [Micromonospora sp. KC213]TDC41939.1 ubiquinone/menaquinone biosynthesis methyltransferase [Micromonospora sp. KC213]